MAAHQAGRFASTLQAPNADAIRDLHGALPAEASGATGTLEER